MDNIIKIYLEKQYFFPDEYELEGIAYESHLKRNVFTVYNKDINVYFVINKHMDLLDKYYGFKKINGNIYGLIYFDLDDDQKLNSRIQGLDKFPNNDNIKRIGTNPFIGISIIKFKFNTYNDDYEMINNEEFISPYLMFVLGYYGGFKICYIINEAQNKDGKIEYKLKEQTEFFKKTNEISNKSLGIEINDEISETEKAKFLYDSNKKESLKEMINRKKINLRNIFLHELDSQIKDNLNKIKKSAYSEKIKIDLSNLGKIVKNKIFEEMQKSIKDLIKNAEELIQQEEENQRFIKKNKEITEKNKILEINIKNQIKQLEDDKNKFKELFLNINSPINLILTHQKMKNFFGENEVDLMIDFFNKIKSNINIFQNHANLIEKINDMNADLIKNIENCKKNYISKKDYNCLKKRKDFEDVKKNIQNNIFIMYMKTFYAYFWDLYQFKEKEMTEELNNLNELKRKYYLQKNLGLNYQKEEEKNENIIINDKKRRKFVLKEEDIDEGNINDNDININSMDILSNLSNSYKNDEQRLVLANNNNIINNDYNSKELLIEREKDALINKLFNTSLVKEKNFFERNKLSEILSNFEGRVTLYDESTEDETCITAEELFSDYLNDEKEKKEKALREKKQKEKDKKINYIKKSLDENKKERDKIEAELKKIEDEKKAEIIEKEKQIQQLKNILEDMNKKYQENIKEREKEKKIYKEAMEKKTNEGQKKILEEQNKNEELIKKYEKDIQDFENKLSQEERKRKEVEEKYKKLEQEKNKNNTNTNNQTTININNNNSNDINNKNIFVRNISSTKVEEKKENEEDTSKNVFKDLRFKPDESINNLELFTSNKNDNATKKEENNNNNDFKDLFKTTTNIKSSTNNIFASSGTGNNKNNIFNFGNNNNSNSQNQNQNQNNQQNIINPSNNLFTNINNNINKNNQPQNKSQNPPNNISDSLFGKNISFGNNFGNQGQTGTLFGQSSLGFGQHRGIGQTDDRKKNENVNPITLSFRSSQNNNTNQINNSTSPFAAASGVGLFGNNNMNNQNGNQNQDNFF